MTAREIIVKHKILPINQSTEDAMLKAMYEYAQQSLPTDEKIDIASVNWAENEWANIDHWDSKSILNKRFRKGADYVISLLKGGLLKGGEE